MIKFLVIDDDQSKVDVIRSSLELLNVEHIDVSTNVLDALNLLKSNKYDVVVLDLNLPIKPNGKIRQDAGLTILNTLCDGDMNVPNSIIGLTSYEKLCDRYKSEFKELDFNLYDFNDYDDWNKAIIGKVGWIQKYNRNTELENKVKVVITVHGIRTAGKWQNNLEDHVDEADVKIFNYKAKYLSSLRILIPFLRRSVERAFSQEFDSIVKKYPDSEYYIFSHSFGSYLIARKLESISPVNSPDVKCVVLAGSVLRRDFNWKNVADKFPRLKVVNDCGIKDVPLIFSEIFSPGLGMAGRRGFFNFENGLVTNRYFMGGHSFFEECDDFYTDNWLPLIDEDFKLKPREIETGFLYELTENLLDNIKWIFWFLILPLVLVVVFN